MSLTWMPPRSSLWLSGMGNAHPPSASGVANHKRSRWRRGAGGEIYLVLERGQIRQKNLRWLG